MLAVSGVRIHLLDSLTESTIGAENGIITLTEAEDTAIGVNYLSDKLLQNWDSGCSSQIDARSYIRPQTFSGGTISIDNITDYWGKLVMFSADIEGKKIERVHYNAGSATVISTHYISGLNVTTDVIQLNLSSIQDTQNVNMTTPIQGDTYYPVIFGSHEYGLYQKEEIEDINPFDGFSNDFLCVDIVKFPDDSTAEIQLTPTDTSIPLADLNIAYEQGYYLECISGAGEGDILPLGDDSGNVLTSFSTGGGKFGAKCNTSNAIFWDELDTPTYKGVGDDGSGFNEDTSVFRLAKKDIKYQSDKYSGFTATGSNIYDKNKVPLSQFGFDKTNGTINQEQINIIDDVVGQPYYSTFDSIEFNNDIDISISGNTQFDNLEFRDDGVWAQSGGYIGTNRSGSIDNIIDDDATTNYQADIQMSGTQGVAISFKIKGDFTDLESILSYVKLEYSFTPSGTSAYKSKMRVDAYWEDINSYIVPASPVNLLELTQDDLASSTTPYTVLYGDYPSSHSGDNENSTSQLYYDNTSISTITGVERAVRGENNYTVDSSNAYVLQKSPTFLVVTFYAQIAPSGNRTYEFQFNSLMKYDSAKTDNDRDSILSPVDGRPYDTFSEVMNHVIKLRNWSTSGISQPSAGWGLGEASVSITDNASNNTAIKSQWNQIRELDTNSFEAQLMVESWDAIHFDKSDTPIISTFPDKLSTDSPEHSFTVPSDCTLLDIEVFDDEDIFNTFTVQYNYDIASNTYQNSITISDVSKSLYDSSYVTGVTDGSDAEQLWDDCHKLFNAIGRERQLPEKRSKLRHIYTESAAIDYINKCLKWFGITRLDTSPAGAYLDTRRVVMEHDITDYNTVEIGDSIQYTIPNVTDNLPSSGVVVGMRYIPDTKRCEIESYVRAQVVSFSIIETGIADTNYIESGTESDNVIEVGQ